jgi:hypothetical protein
MEGSFIIDEDDIEILLTEQFYFQINTEAHLTGEVRGQIRRISKHLVSYLIGRVDLLTKNILDPCSSDGDSFSVPDSTYGNAILSYFQTLYLSDFSGDIYDLVASGEQLKIQLGLVALTVGVALFI